MVAGVNAGGQVGVVSMTALRYAQADGGDVIMPVRPDSRLDDGVPLYKLKILDTLIDHLSAKKPAAAVDAGSIDNTIIEMSRSMRTSGGGTAGGAFGAMAGGPSASYRAGFLPPPGAFVDLVA